MTGEVTKLLKDRNFGFIVGNADSKEYFFHRDDCAPGLWDDLLYRFHADESLMVEFDVVEFSPKGPRAANVRRLE